MAVVNRHSEQSVTAVVSFAGPESLEIFETIEIRCPSWDTVNGFAVVDQVTRITKTDARYAPDQEYVFPPYSITLLKHRYIIDNNL